MSVPVRAFEMKYFLLTLFCLTQTIQCGALSSLSGNEGETHHLVKRTSKHHGLGVGSSCTVKGSYCSCHYCRCDHGFIHCIKHGAVAYHHGIGKNYCYGHMEGEHCQCDYCKCKHGYGEHGKHGGCGGGNSFYY